MRRRSTFLLAIGTFFFCGMGLLPPAARAAESKGEGDSETRRRGEDRRGGWRERSPEERQRRMDEFRKRADQWLRDALMVKDDVTWKTIKTRMDAVRKAEANLRGDRGPFVFDPRRAGSPGSRGSEGRGPRGPREGDDRRPETEVGKKTAALRELLQKEDAKAADIDAALTALRTTRARAEKDLVDARAKLREVATKRQEAMLVLMHMLK